MTAMKPGDLVVLKSGGPTMTVDTVNSDIFDDDRITGVLCVWFVGEKLERVRFDHRAIELAPLPQASPRNTAAPPEEASGDYKTVLDEMVTAMNVAADAGKAVSRSGKRSKPAASKRDIVAAAPVVSGVGAD
jgi:uncharacterized protein YodC (DUF2158 family)